MNSTRQRITLLTLTLVLSAVPIFWVSASGTVVKEAKNLGLELINTQGKPALVWACLNGHTEVAKLLIEQGADLNIQDVFSLTALRWACINDHTEVAKLLIEKGAVLNKQGEDSHTALRWACIHGHTEICKAILSHAIILPELTEKDFKLMLYKLWKKFQCSKDMRVAIALKLELKQLLYFASTKEYCNQFKDGFLAKVDEIAEYTIEALMPMMVEVRNLSGVTQEVKDLINPEHYEENFGVVLRKNIETVILEKRLHLFVRLLKDNSSDEVAEEKEEELKRLSRRYLEHSIITCSFASLSRDRLLY